MEEELSDLKIIDELLVLARPQGMTWAAMENDLNIYRVAMQRLRRAWQSGEMPEITLSLANYFEGK